MSNQKTSQFRRVSGSQLVAGDLIPLVDVSENTSPTGETKAIYAGELAKYIVSGGFLEVFTPMHGYQSANGLVFDQYVAPASDLNLRCYGEFQEVGTEFSLMVRAFVPSSIYTETSSRAIFGIGESQETLVSGSQTAYIGLQDNDLVGYTYDGIVEKKIEVTDFIYDYEDKVFESVLTRDSSGTLKLYLNSTLIGTLSGSATPISSSYVVMGNGHLDAFNIDCTIYEAHVFNTELTANNVKSMFYGGVKNSDTTLIASYTSPNLNPGPTQWLDSKGTNHILLPVSGAAASNPDKEFSLRFKSDGTSGFLGNGTERDILPENYVLTDAFVYSTGSPLLSIGSTSSVAPVGASGIYSWNNNRVPLTNAIYSRNNLQLLELGVAHTDRSLYVFYSSSAAPCTFSFEGYISDYGASTYSPPAPVIISSLYETATNTIPYSYQILATNYPLIYSSSNLPNGLSLNNYTGLISGTPSAGANTYYVQLFAANYDATGSAFMTMSLAPAPTTTTAAPTTTTAAVTTTTGAATTTTAAVTTTTAAAAVTTTTAAGTTTTAAVTTTTTLAPFGYTQVVVTGATNCYSSDNTLIAGFSAEGISTYITRVVTWDRAASPSDPVYLGGDLIATTLTGGEFNYNPGVSTVVGAGQHTLTYARGGSSPSSATITITRAGGGDGTMIDASARSLVTIANSLAMTVYGITGSPHKTRVRNCTPVSSDSDVENLTGAVENITIVGSLGDKIGWLQVTAQTSEFSAPELTPVNCATTTTTGAGTTTTGEGTTTTGAGTTTTGEGTTTTGEGTTTTGEGTTTTGEGTTTTGEGTTTTGAGTTTTGAGTTTTGEGTTTTGEGTTTTGAGTTTTPIPCYQRTWLFTQTDNYDNTDPENPIYISTTYDIDTGQYTECDGNVYQYDVTVTLDHPDDPGYVNHNACIQGVGLPVCLG